MDAIAICIEGLEFITQGEIKEILHKESKIVIQSRVKFSFKKDSDLANFIVNSRSAIKAYKLIDNFEFTILDNLLIKIRKTEFPKIKDPFVVRCERFGNHEFNSIDVEKQAGDIVNKYSKLKVDLDNPNTIIIIDIVNQNCFIGIDYTGIKLSKRNYRIRLLANSLSPCLAYSMLRISEINDKETILDPFCRSGEILIEAALYLKNIQPNLKLIDKLAFTKLIKFKPKENKQKDKKFKIKGIDSSQNNLKSAEINSKIAGINKNIEFSRYDVEWLDTKFNKSSVGKIVTFPNYPTNNLPKEKVEKIYREFFYQAEFILNKKGTITILTPVPQTIEKYAKEYKFKKEKEYKVKHQNSDFYIVLYKKSF